MGIEEWVELGGEVWAELEGLGLGMRLGCLGGLTIRKSCKTIYTHCLSLLDYLYGRLIY